MKVLLCQDVDDLGYLGDIIEVKNGYARNYLLPQNIAIVPTKSNIRSLAQAKAKSVGVRKLVYEQLEHAAAAVNGAEAVVAAKANEQGHLFGSVTEHDIAANLREQGFEVTDKMVKLDEHIKEVGSSEVLLMLAPDLTATVNLVVVAEGDTQDAQTQGQAEDDAEASQNEK